jgi:hypothetical protein
MKSAFGASLPSVRSEHVAVNGSNTPCRPSPAPRTNGWGCTAGPRTRSETSNEWANFSETARVLGQLQ